MNNINESMIRGYIAKRHADGRANATIVLLVSHAILFAITCLIRPFGVPQGRGILAYSGVDPLKCRLPFQKFWREVIRGDFCGIRARGERNVR